MRCISPNLDALHTHLTKSLPWTLSRSWIILANRRTSSEALPRLKKLGGGNEEVLQSWEGSVACHLRVWMRHTLLRQNIRRCLYSWPCSWCSQRHGPMQQIWKLQQTQELLRENLWIIRIENIQRRLKTMELHPYCWFCEEIRRKGNACAFKRKQCYNSSKSQ